MSRGGPPALTIRDAAAADVPAIVALEASSFSDPWSAQSFRGLVGAAQARLRVGILDGQVVGYAVAWHVGDEAELANLAVAEGARRRGIGTRLLDDLLAHADVAPGQAVYLEVREGNAAAQALYRSRGFEIVGRRRGYYRRPDEDAVVMRRAARGD